MDGLKHILSEIEKDASAQVRQIEEEAKKDAEKIITQAKLNAQKQAETIIALAEKKAKQKEENAKSSAELLIKKAILSAKSDVVASGINYALDKILSLGDEEYFSLIYSLISKYAQSGNGEIMLNERDLKRLPNGFIERANALLSGGSLSLCKSSADISGGVVLVYGMIEENCSFEALLSEYKADITDALCAAF